MIEQLQHEKDLSRPKLFSIMYGVQNNKTDLMNRLQFKDLALSLENVVDTENKSSRFDLNFVVDQFGSDIMFSCIYNADLFDGSSVDLMLQNMTVLMDQVLDNPDQPLHAYTMVAPDAADAGVTHGLVLPYTPHASMHSLMQDQAARTPDAVAVRINESLYSYAALNTQANQMAHYLLSLGVNPGDNVVVALPPSFELIVALYAVLKVGGCFVPVSPQYPQKRVDSILKNTRAHWVLTLTVHRRVFSNFAYDVVLIDEVMGALTGYAASNPEAAFDASSAAYILHTSGSTGVPKGIQIAHAGVVSMLQDLQHTYALTAADRVLFHTPFTFDVFIQDVFWPLMAGASVVIAPEDMLKSSKDIAALIAREHVTLAQFVPATLEALVEARERGAVAELASLRQVICGAAALYRQLLERFNRVFAACQLANHYGPTEVTVDACRFDCSQPFVGDTVPIGRPVANASVYVLDAHLQAVPQGVIGELYVASPGLALAYLNDASGTQQAFITRNGERLYKTGDLGRRDRTGLIYFHGRRDKQFKIRGNRVELEEISSVLRSHAGVALAAIVYQEDAQRNGRLIAYVEPADLQLTQDAVKAWLRQQLPDYMIPDVVQFIAALPLTDSGKVDTKELPAVALVAQQDKHLASTTLQHELTALWQGLLQLSNIGVTDDFFVLGGQSLKAIEMVAAVAERYGVKLNLRQFYENPTIRFVESQLTDHA